MTLKSFWTCRRSLSCLAGSLALTLMGLLVLLTISSDASGEGSGLWPPDAGLDWVVDEDTEGYNTTIRLTNSILLLNGSLLHLEDVTFIFAGDEVGDIGLKVVGGSRLEMVNVTFRSDSPGGYYLSLADDTQGYWDNVSISGVSDTEPYMDGTVVNSGDLTISNSVFHDSTNGIITNAALELSNNTFYNTSVAILSLGDLHLDGVRNNTFDHEGYNNTQARFRHLEPVDIKVFDQFDDSISNAIVTAVDEFNVTRLTMATWNDGKLWGAYLVDEELELTGQERYPHIYDLSVSYITANTTAGLDLNTTTSLDINLPLLSQVVAGPLYAPLPTPLEVIRPGRDNTTSMVWTTEPGDTWQDIDHDDSGWNSGTLPIGNTTVEDVEPATIWDGGVVYLRIAFYLPQDSRVYNGTLHWSCTTVTGNDRVNIYINGPNAQAAWQGTASYWSGTKTVSGDYFKPGLNVLTVRYQAMMSPFLDLRLEVLVARQPDQPLIGGSPQGLMVVISNEGSRLAELMDIEIWLDGDLEFTLTRTIDPDSFKIFRFTLPLLTTGNHSIELRLDPGQELDDEVLDDNVAWLNLTAYRVAFGVVDPPDKMTLHTYDEGQGVVEVINQGDVDDWPELFVPVQWANWSVELVPPVPRLAPGERANITLDLSPPAAIAEGEYTLELQLGSQLGPLSDGSRDPLNITVEVLQSNDLSLWIGTGALLFPLGVETPITLELRNQGNRDDTANLSLEGLEAAVEDGWNITLVTKVANVDAGESYLVGLEATLLRAGARQPTQITVVAVSMTNASVRTTINLSLFPAGFSMADPLSTYQTSAEFNIPWSMLDLEGQFERVDMHYREMEQGGSWTSWEPFQFDLTEGNYPSIIGKDAYTYEFYTIAHFIGGEHEVKNVAESVTLVDLSPPRSRLTLHSPVNNDDETIHTLVNLSWRDLDPDIVDYTLEAHIDGHTWITLVEHTTDTEGTFELESGHKYMIRTRARDLAGWTELESSGYNRITIDILHRPYWTQLLTNTSYSRDEQITGWVLQEPQAEARIVWVQYLNDLDEWVSYQRVVLAEPHQTPALNTSFDLELPLEGTNHLRVVVEDANGDKVEPGVWQVTYLGNGLTDLEIPMQRIPFWDSLEVMADPDGDGIFDLALTLGDSNLGYEIVEKNQIVRFGDNLQGYRPALNEPLQATYQAYDSLVLRDHLPPEAPQWVQVKADNQTRNLVLQVQIMALDEVVSYWWESRLADTTWSRHGSEITVIMNEGLVEQPFYNLTTELEYRYRVGVKDEFDRVSYSEVTTVNLSVYVPDIPTEPSDDGGPSTQLLFLVIIIAMAFIGGVAAKFKMDQRREIQAQKMPFPSYPENGLQDYSLVGFEILDRGSNERLTVECRACGTRRNVTPAQAKEEVTCFGCGIVSPLDPPGQDMEEGGEPDDSDEPLPVTSIPDKEFSPEISVDTAGTETKTEEAPFPGVLPEPAFIPTLKQLRAGIVPGTGTDESEPRSESDEPEPEPVTTDEPIEPTGPEESPEQPSVETPEADQIGREQPARAPPGFCPQCGVELLASSPEELPACQECGWRE